MFKRARWAGVGFGAGVGAAVWAEVKLRRRAPRLTPAAIGGEVAARAEALGAELRDAVRDGRRAMAAREAELRAEHAPRRGAPGQRGPADTAEELAPPSGAGGGQVIDLPLGPGLRPALGRERRRRLAVPWTDHGHERPSARLS